MTAELDRALARLPEYRRLAEALARVRAQQAAPQPVEATVPVEPWRQVAEDAVEVVVAGGEVDEVLVARYATATAPAARPGHVVRHELLAGVVDRLRPQMAAMVESHADELLGFLAEALEEVLGEVRGQDVAGDEQVFRYGGIRAAQREVVEAILGQGQQTGSLIANVGLISNMAELDPLLVDELHPERPSIRSDDRVAARRQLPPVPWPAPIVGDRSVWPTTARHEYLAWLAGPVPKPWVPSTGELVEAGRDLSAQIRAARAAVRLDTGQNLFRAVRV